ncbi:hypothetical protein JYU34_001467 [Plutella xylostella]|uniref:Protein sleepless n=2 Tax=Plutella xylostella TaxID=51655 RepID=A0ABQ7R411_PLUXY|nr:uncharacterized protein LOC105382543 isoform X1 [Plutella xylostella]KAG7312027.1 hypothetical protein JYU34_001467 [Plutella xylostella]
MASCWLVWLTMLGFVAQGLAIMCYECNSATNSYCAEKILPDNLKRNCSERDRGDIVHTLCRKITQHVDVEVEGQRPGARVVRTCGWDDSKYKSSCYHRSGFGSRHEVCACAADLCNSAPAAAAGATVALAAAAILKLG